MENTKRTKITIIGGGPGGYAAAIFGARLNADVTLIEKKKLGGTCLNAGCIPTKALKQCADVLNMVRASKMYGITTENVQFDLKKASKFKDEVVNHLVFGVEYFIKKNKIKSINGTGKIINNTTVEVCNSNEVKRIKTDYIIIATGTKEIEIPGFSTNSKNVLNSTEILSMQKLPKSLLIIGGGVIGVEFASIYNKLGVDVKIVELTERLIPFEDEEVSRVLEDTLKKAGVKIFTGCSAKKYENINEKLLSVSIEKKGVHIENVFCEEILVCVGRKTCFEGFNPEALGIKTERDRIVTDNHMKTSVDNIYAIGDVALSDQLAHVAYTEARIAMLNIMGQDSEIDYCAVPHCIYTSPEIASVGLSEEKARLDFIDINVSRFSFAGNGKALIGGDYNGFIKVISCSKTGILLGFSIIGPKATELIAEPTLALTKNMTVKDITDTIHAHPTLTEVIGEVCLSSEGLGLHSK